MDSPDVDEAGQPSSGFSRGELAAIAGQFSRSPIAFALTEGTAHVLRYSNAAFRELISAGEIAIDQPPRTSTLTRGAFVGLLDRAVRGETIRDEPFGSPSDTARWTCTAWLIDSAATTGLVVEVRDAAGAPHVVDRQRRLSEQLLLSALRERDAKQRAIEAGGRASFLAEASRSLARSLDEDATRRLLQHSMLPRPGTWCIVDLIEPDGKIHRLAVVHPDPAKQQLARQLVDAWYPIPRDPLDPLSIERLASKRPAVLTRDSGTALVSAAHGPENLAVLHQLGFGSLLIVPLVGRDAVLGTMTFVNPDDDEAFSADEVALASELAERSALALDNARLYRETDSLRAAADHANRAKSEFLRTVGHELRTPLHAISAYVDLLDRTHDAWTAEQRSDLDRIKHNQRHLVALSSQLVDFVRAETGRVEYHLTTVSVAEALSDVAALLEGAARESHLAFDFPSAPVDVCVWADPDRVRQILLNLVMNAVKYSAIGGGAVALGFTSIEDTVLIQVSDSGPGIAEEKLEAIFEQYVQLPGGAPNRRGGVGLGLGISRDLARGMGGNLTAESTLGAGSRFTLTLPRAPSR